MKKLKEKVGKRQEKGAEKSEMSYTYRAIRAAQRLRTLSENGGRGVRRGREDKCDKKGGCIKNLFKIVFTHGKKFYILLN
jgi:hypothetical protein